MRYSEWITVILFQQHYTNLKSIHNLIISMPRPEGGKNSATTSISIWYDSR